MVHVRQWLHGCRRACCVYVSPYIGPSTRIRVHTRADPVNRLVYVCVCVGGWGVQILLKGLKTCSVKGGGVQMLLVRLKTCSVCVCVWGGSKCC